MAKPELRIVEPVNHEGLTARQTIIHQLMLEMQAERGMPATIRELVDAYSSSQRRLRCKTGRGVSTGTMVTDLKAIERAGYATQVAGKARGWVAHRRGDSPRFLLIGVLSRTVDVMPEIPLGRLLMRAADGRLADLTDADLAQRVTELGERYRRAGRE